MRIGLVGFGAIGSLIAEEFGKSIAWVVDSDAAVRKKAERILRCAVLQKIPAKCGGAELVVEAAGQSAVKLLVPCLRHCNVMVMSVGALQDRKLLRKLEAQAKKHGHYVYLPSGAIGGLDAISSVAERGAQVLLETVKPPSALGRKDIVRTVIFEGDAAEACRKLPKNINVAATLALAGVGFERTKVRIISDPKVKNNTHTITVKSKAGSMSFKFENIPLQGNPKTSALAAVSAMHRIKKADVPIKIG